MIRWTIKFIGGPLDGAIGRFTTRHTDKKQVGMPLGKGANYVLEFETATATHVVDFPSNMLIADIDDAQKITDEFLNG